jgi:hypothetical protein
LLDGKGVVRCIDSPNKQLKEELCADWWYFEGYPLRKLPVDFKLLAYTISEKTYRGPHLSMMFTEKSLLLK